MIGLTELRGRWHLIRIIEDLHGGVIGHLKGEAVWSEDAGGLVQDENGLLRYGDASPMQATRRYLWREDGQKWHVFFDDGRPFHVVPEKGQEAVHHCAPDVYRVTYDILSTTAFCQSWRVTGPRKNAIISSSFQRI